jgi:hypothetical protein
LEVFLADQDEVLIPPGDGGCRHRLAGSQRRSSTLRGSRMAPGNGQPARMGREIEATRA